MALIICWYDFVCFGIVVGAFIGTLWILWMKELAAATKCEEESLLMPRTNDQDVSVMSATTPNNARVMSSQLWLSCWKGVHPGWLFVTRLVSLVVMVGVLTWDVLSWDASVFMYYTEEIWLTSETLSISFWILNRITMEVDQGFRYLLRWQVPVCAMVMVAPAIFALKFMKKAKQQPIFLDTLYKPCWRNLNPLWLLFTRIFAFICSTWILVEAVAEDGAFAFYFYTQWTFTLVTVYFALGTVISAYGCWVTATSLPTTNADEFRHKAGFWGYVFQALYQTCGGAICITDIVFWCIIAPFSANVHLGLNALTGCMHTLNAVFLLIDTYLNSLSFPWFRIAYFVQWSCIYIVFQWIIHACGFTWWPYPFIQLDTPWAPLLYFCLALLHVPCYGIFVLIVKAKYSILPRLFPHSFVRSR